ncbi:MAG TPA: cytochrome c peroxidase, partial [Burkholderiaceae bacterium]|nr:cytochrome c peroxidase [Burkholderiaceae bacterium]
MQPSGAVVVIATLAFFLSACGRQDNSLDKSGASTASPAVAAAVAAVPSPAPAPASASVAQAALARLNAPVVPLSAVAELGKKMFHDASLSASGKLSCASCHNPNNAHAPAND